MCEIEPPVFTYPVHLSLGIRGWPEREVFGKVRYMNARGLERKFDMDAYVEAVDKLVEEEC